MSSQAVCCHTVVLRVCVAQQQQQQQHRDGATQREGETTCVWTLAGERVCVCVCVCVHRDKKKGPYLFQSLTRVFTEWRCVCLSIRFCCPVNTLQPRGTIAHLPDHTLPPGSFSRVCVCVCACVLRNSKPPPPSPCLISSVSLLLVPALPLIHHPAPLGVTVPGGGASI